MNLEDFAYQLPPELIAKNPTEKRDQSRLLYYNRQTKNICHLKFADISTVLKSDDLLVVNNTRVIPARLVGQRKSGGLVDILLLKKEPDCIGVWQAMAMPLKKLKIGDILTVRGKENDYALTIENIFIAADGQRRLLIKINDDANNEDQTFNLLQEMGCAPLPPYIVNARQTSLPKESQSAYDSTFPKNEDLERYQTIFAKTSGAVAAPTAGLHFSPQLILDLQNKGIEIQEITLHVGPGTFKPITTAIEDHIVEEEWFSISSPVSEAINKAKNEGRRVIAVGTTTCRALESVYINGRLIPQEGHTSLFIKPGYNFKLIDGLITNFHLSKSSLLLLVAAFMGREELLKTYQEAIALRYRFYSYGDAMLIL